MSESHGLKPPPNPAHTLKSVAGWERVHCEQGTTQTEDRWRRTVGLTRTTITLPQTLPMQGTKPQLYKCFLADHWSRHRCAGPRSRPLQASTEPHHSPTGCSVAGEPWTGRTQTVPHLRHRRRARWRCSGRRAPASWKQNSSIAVTVPHRGNELAAPLVAVTAARWHANRVATAGPGTASHCDVRCHQPLQFLPASLRLGCILQPLCCAVQYMQLCRLLE